MFQVIPVLMVIMVGGTVICSIYNAFSTSHISDDMSEWSNSSSKYDYNNYDQRDYEQAVEEQIKVHASVHKQEKEIKKNNNLFDDDYFNEKYIENHLEHNVIGGEKNEFKYG